MTTIDQLTTDREAFNAFVYTPIDEAIKQLKKRGSDNALQSYVHKKLQNVPDVLKTGIKSAVLSRPIASPNYELRRFVSIIDAIGTLKPVIWQYTESKFTPNMNELKHGLGKIVFNFGRGKNGGTKTKPLNIVDFNVYSGKKMSDVTTVWGQGLVDLHHELFKEAYKDSKYKNMHLFDGSKWYNDSGGSAKEYYESFLGLFLCDAILFENFMLDKKELLFTKEVFLPAFIKVYEETGYKPLIVALAPTEIEGDNFWMQYPGESMDFIKNKLQ